MLNKTNKNRVAVTLFGSASKKIPDIYKQEATHLGELIAQKGWVQYNGGGSEGIMGAATSGGIKHKGEVHGIIENDFHPWRHMELSSCQVTNGLMSRITGLVEASDAIVALPGGVGTLSEIFYFLDTLASSYAIGKAIGKLEESTNKLILLNTKGFYNPLMQWLSEHIVEQGFLSHGASTKLITIADTPLDVIQRLSELFTIRSS